jgi:hypothetical protein
MILVAMVKKFRGKDRCNGKSFFPNKEAILADRLSKRIV